MVPFPQFPPPWSASCRSELRRLLAPLPRRFFRNACTRSKIAVESFDPRRATFFHPLGPPPPIVQQVGLVLLFPWRFMNFLSRVLSCSLMLMRSFSFFVSPSCAPLYGVFCKGKGPGSPPDALSTFGCSFPRSSPPDGRCVSTPLWFPVSFTLSSFSPLFFLKQAGLFLSFSNNRDTFPPFPP